MNEQQTEKMADSGAGNKRKVWQTSWILLLAALLVSLPIYLATLLWFGDPLFTGSIAGSGTSASEIPITSIGGMDYSPQRRTPIDSKEELLKKIICTFEIKSGQMLDRVYLRINTFERFSKKSMSSYFERDPDKSWPHFAFSETAAALTPAYVADLHFFCNFEERLIHPPVLSDLAGPLPFCPMRDGSVVLEQTIAVGDEFELRYIDQQRLTAHDVIARVANDSPYLTTDHLLSEELLAIADKAAENADNGVATVFAIADFLEKNGEYRSDVVYKGEEHPVKEFLLGSLAGHCQHFSSSLVLLCRLKGIPARVAAGFLSDKKCDNRFIVVSGMAHAWAEVLTNKGWKIVDAQPASFNREPVVDKDLIMPTASELDTLKDRMQRENQRRYGKKDARGQTGQDEGDAETSFEDAPRIGHNRIDQQNYEAAKTPGTVVKDEKRAAEYHEQIARREEQKRSERQKQWVRGLINSLLSLITITLVIWVASRHFKKLLKWLQKLLNQEQSAEENTEQHVDELRQNIENMLTKSDFVLAGSDVVRLFNSFTEIMAERGILPRSKHETPGEYFGRICLELNFRPAEGQAAARCFEAELYGGHKAGADDTKKFLQFLQHVLTRLN